MHILPDGHRSIRLASCKRRHSDGGFSQLFPRISHTNLHPKLFPSYRNILPHIDNEILQYNYNMFHCLNMDWPNIHRYHIDKLRLYTMMNIDIESHEFD